MGGLKKWLDGHPAAVAVGLVVTVASTASGTTAYFLAQKNEIEKAEIGREHKALVADLTGRLSSIERRAGAPQERKYLDVKSMQISSQEIRNLSPDFKAVDGGRLFVSAPAAGNWTAATLTEKQIMQLGPLKSLFVGVETNANLEKIMSDTVFAWHTKPVADVAFDFEQGAQKNHITGVLTPHVFIQKISRQQLLEKQHAALTLLTDAFGQKSKPKSEKPAGKNDAVKDLEQAISESSSKGTARAKEPEQENQDLHYLKAKFEQIFDSDTAGYIFFDTLSKMMNLSVLSSTVSFGINSAQKQFNVMYVDGELTFSNVEITNSVDEFCQNGKGKTVSLRREIFFVSYPQESYLIQTEVPTCGGRSAAFDWISQWLSGLRIAVKA